MNHRHAPLVCCLLLVSIKTLVPAGQAIPPVPEHYVTDKADFLLSALREDLDGRLAAFERTSGIQFIIYIDRSSGGIPIEEWAAKAFSAWGVGKKGQDNGLALFLFSADHRVHIEVGYGLEARVPDAMAARVINDIITPHLQTDDRNGAISTAADALMAAATGQAAPEENPGNPQPPAAKPIGKKLTPLQTIFVGLLILGFLILLVTHPALAIWLLFNIMSGGRGGGGGGSGGFRGGGGRSGGGGASGSW